jgi:hypothetical protein
MSLVCLVLGIAAAGAATALLASAAETLRRRFGRGKREGAAGGRALRNISAAGGNALLSSSWGESGENLVVLAEPGKAGENLARELYRNLQEQRGFLSLHPGPSGDVDRSDPLRTVEQRVPEMLAELREKQGIETAGETFIALGWAGDGLLRLRSVLERDYGPRELLLVAPVVPDCASGFIGDALLSNTPQDITTSLLARKAWKGDRFKRMLRIWLPLLAVCVILATAVTVAFDVRWKFVSGPAVGLILSIWAAYFLAVRRGGISGESAESRSLALLCEPAAPGSSPITVVLVSSDHDLVAGLPPESAKVYDEARLELWEDVLRGKFLLGRGTMARLATLIRQQPEEGHESVPTIERPQHMEGENTHGEQRR